MKNPKILMVTEDVDSALFVIPVIMDFLEADKLSSVFCLPGVAVDFLFKEEFDSLFIDNQIKGHFKRVIIYTAETRGVNVVIFKKSVNTDENEQIIPVSRLTSLDKIRLN